MEGFVRVLHVTLLVTWLGIDVGVFLSSFVIRRRGLSPDARVEIRRIMRALDLAPRVSLVLMVPVALWMTSLTGFDAGLLSPAVLALVTLVGAAWALAIVVAYRRLDPLGNRRAPTDRFDGAFPRADLVLRVVVAVGFLAAGIASLAGAGPWLGTHVAWKSLIFGLTVGAGLWIRIGATGFAPALRETVLQGETPERMARMDRAMRRAYPAVLSVWSGVAAMAVLGIVGVSA